MPCRFDYLSSVSMRGGRVSNGVEQPRMAAICHTECRSVTSAGGKLSLKLIVAFIS